MKEGKALIGLEIHCYLITKEKLFCKCEASRERGLKPNINICPICTGQPGAKPMLPNIEAIKKAIAIGLILGCKINSFLEWRRKHYNWPDLPKGYQNTLSGANSIPVGENGNFHSIKIWSMHLEEDPASWNPETGEIDYNRSGLPLVEIITAPDFTDSKEVVEWLKKLLHSLSYLKAVDSNAGIKVDVNVNIKGKTERVEIKNISSLENIEKAIDYEVKRQLREDVPFRETRRYDEKEQKTMVMRSKEGQEDYRFIKDPDLPPIIINNEMIADIRDKLPEMPEKKLEKLIKKYKIDSKNAEILTKNLEIVEFFEKVSEKIEASFALPWITIELLRFLRYNNKKLSEVKIQPEHFIELLKLVKDGKITPLKAKEILNKFYPESFMPEASTEKRITNEKEIEKAVDEVISKNSKAVNDYKTGDKKAINFLIGEVMKITNKRADYKITKQILEKKL